MIAGKIVIDVIIHSFTVQTTIQRQRHGMKVVHILKRIEMIDEDIKDLRRLEKQITRNKTFTSPIYITIEKQVNILLDERIKLMGLKIENPPAHLVEMIEGTSSEPVTEPEPQKARPKPEVKAKPAPKKAARPKKQENSELDDDDLPLMTQDIIDARINELQVEMTRESTTAAKPEEKKDDENIDYSDQNVKILDIALERGSLSKKAEEKEKKVRFFRENFPSE